MRANPLKSCAGFTFIAALMIVIIIGIMLGATMQSWQTVMKREKEEELLFRGGQILDAIGRWRKPPPPLPPNGQLRELKDLLEGSSLQKVRYLRRIYKDPITNKDFKLITD
ncbi:MAG TPA: type II secretion system protein, partial [Geobacteraceae bacterium]|nr:type II secretion system protein [Geobacteraceae bacterium]